MGEFSISPPELYRLMGSAEAPLLYDVCKCEDYDGQPLMLPAAAWRDHQQVEAWAGEIPRGARVVVSCVRGLKVSQSAAAELRLRGIDAAILEGGVEGWIKAGLPTVRKLHGIGGRGAAPSRWVTRVRPKIDRIACPWLINRFLDRRARFFYVNPDQVLNAAKDLGAIPYDVPDVELTHRGPTGNEACTFDTLIDVFGIEDRALEEVALIVRGADTSRMDLAPEAAGLLAVSLGISALSGPDDHVALERGFPVYDALYAWRRHAAAETHGWPPAKA